MSNPYEIELLTVKLELQAATDEYMRLVRQNTAFGPQWTAASERHARAVANWRRVVARPSAPNVSITAPRDIDQIHLIVRRVAG
ncbi:hypothetical protein [Pseudomonas lutea]|jgi:hypothetical protein|uniref:Uncharacterized protein n=1 Tax=Pseudomonas lutea TaxID=243924 RepID=A0A9X0EAZ8_9PSED|nr:hypothetical protein [Pseudomonas lutea]KGF62524.1 hypothetical protein LT42_21955 [Pseudomonas lutea]